MTASRKTTLRAVRSRTCRESATPSPRPNTEALLDLLCEPEAINALGNLDDARVQQAVKHLRAIRANRVLAEAVAIVRGTQQNPEPGP